ncbi:hypothetical protein BXZ70DRAFT_1006103 [Cristinia sonorae]|uniref:Uncharacterized protein n=1 Tax=Cristinia sonorae TaxID=1940300 RepID=A0A8K0UTG9_9AGAR|nr:hypothetical protein BXZ70DRAFT_1006103 [Cristinia sonorae]
MSTRRSSPRATARLRRAPLARSSSLLGTLKSIVAAPLTWFASSDDIQDVPGEKRPRRVQQEESNRDQGAEGDEEHRSKRKRIHSPDLDGAFPRQNQHYQPERSGYLDPPQSMLVKRASVPNASSATPSYARSSSALPSTQSRNQHRSRLSLSPRPSTGHGKQTGIARTQSMDPPGRLLIPPRSTRPPPLSRAASMMSVDEPPSSPLSPVGDMSMSPSRPRFKLRTSLTPQPSGVDFGPTPVRRERDPSEPPPLEALMENPIFVKAPPNPQPPQRQASLTLGSLAETHKAQPLSRQRSNLTTVASASTNSVRPINAAELALHELEVYKTPLLPSRLRGSSALPDMFKPRKGAQRVGPSLLIDGDRDERPRLGRSDLESAKKEDGKGKKAKGAKPYEGQGGMKKLLARRRLEEAEELEKEKEAAMTDNEEIAATEQSEVAKKLTKELELPVAPEPLTVVGGRPQSSLRVGRTRTARNHAPAMRPKSKNKFSAVYEDEEGEDAAMFMGTEEVGSDAPPASTSHEPEVPLPKYEAPKGFSFAKETGPIQHDATGAKEPPIAALPFSLTAKPAPTSGNTVIPSPLFPSSAPATPLPPTSSTNVSTTPAPATIPSVPSITLIPASPASAQKDEEKEKPVPNFFANAAIFSKPSSQLPFSLTTSSTVATPAAPAPGGFSWGTTGQTATPAGTSSDKDTPKTVTSTSSLFGASSPGSKSSQIPAASVSAPAVPFTTPSTSLFGKPVSEPARKDETSAPAPVTTSLFGDRSKDATMPSTAPSTSSPFSFGVAKPTEVSVTPTVPAPAPLATPFSFGAPPKVEKENEVTQQAPATKPSLFPSSSAATTPSLSGFGSQPLASSTSSPVEPPKPFTFGPSASTVPASASSTTSAIPAIAAPKPLFGSAPESSIPASPFSFGTSPSAPPEVTTPAKSPFTFGASAPSTPNPEKKTTNAFMFGSSSPAPAPSASTSLFGTPSGGSNGTDVSKGFSFGTSTPVRNVTPPRGNDEEVNMDESPTRGAGMDVNGGAKPTLAGFGFGTSNASSPFGQPASTGSSFSFGATSGSSMSSPFASKVENKPVEKPALTFTGFGQQATSTNNAFGFGASNSTQSTQPAPSAGAFGFGTPVSTPTATSSPFSFGAPAPPAPTPFGQPATAAPTSSGFSTQPASGFSFGASPAATPTTAPSNPFSFSGSQPASPAVSNSGLPSGAFSFGQPSSSANPAVDTGSPSPFGGTTPLPTAGGGGALFTMGAAPPPPPSGAGRPLKKLPSRRGGKR